MASQETVNETTPKISIVVPFYKTEAYLNRCLDSLLAQTLKDIEIICVNDESPDNCLIKLREYENDYPDIIRVVDKRNGGLWAARWSGTDKARGKYVTYVDSDDYVDPEFAESFWNTAVREDADVVVCGFNRVAEETGKTLSTEMASQMQSFCAHEQPGKLIQINPAAWNKCFRRSLLIRMDRLEEPPAILEDVTLSQLAYLASTKPIAFTGNATYQYMIHENSMINTVTLPQVESVKRALTEVAHHFDSDDAELALRQSLDATVFLHLGVSMSFRLSCNKDGTFNLTEQIKKTTEYLDCNFPSWRKNPYLTFSYARKHGGAYSKLYLANLAYKAHLMGPALATYRFLLNVLGKEIKW